MNKVLALVVATAMGLSSAVFAADTAPHSPSGANQPQQATHTSKHKHQETQKAQAAKKHHTKQAAPQKAQAAKKHHQHSAPTTNTKTEPTAG